MDDTDFSNPKFTFASPRPQQFSIPENIVHYLTKNPSSSRAWKKLVKTSKYFFPKNQIIVVDSLKPTETDLGDRELTIWEASLRRKSKIINVKTYPFKLWLTGRLMAMYNTNGINRMFISKIYRSDILHLNLDNESIFFDHLCFLTSSNKLKTLSINNVIFKNDDGSMAEFDKILKLLPNIRDLQISFRHENPVLSSEVVGQINELPTFKKLINFQFENVLEGFDIEAFTIFMKKHRHAKFNLTFSHNITSAEYIARLQNFADSIINEEKNHGVRVLINFPQLDMEKAKMIEEIYLTPTEYDENGRNAKRRRVH